MLNLFRAVTHGVCGVCFLTFAACSMEESQENQTRDSGRHHMVTMEPLVIPKEKHTPSIGKEYWEQAKERFSATTYQIMKINHLFLNKHGLQNESGILLEFFQSFNHLGRVNLTLKDAFQGLNVSVKLGEKGAPLYLILLHFNATVFEVADLVQTFWQSTYYYRQDLEKLKALLGDLVCLFNYAEDVIKRASGAKETGYDHKAVRQELEKCLYAPAAIVNRSLSEYVTYIKENCDGSLSIEEFITLSSRFYAIEFSNIYTMVQAHLDGNQGGAATKLFNRNFKNRRQVLPLYDLISCDFSQALEKRILEENLADDQVTSLPKKKNKKRRHKKKKVRAPEVIKQETVCVDEAVPNADSVISDTVIAAEPEEVGPKPHIAFPIPEEKEAPVEVLLPQKLEKEEGTPVTNRPKPILTPSKVLKSGKETPQVKREEASSKLYRLHEILSEYDKGIQAGMKTRRFLRLAAALNKLGYFNSFMANAKQVRINIQPNSVVPTGMVTTMHTNHKGRGQDQGITGPTADKMNEVIAIVKQLSEGPNQEK